MRRGVVYNKNGNIPAADLVEDDAGRFTLTYRTAYLADARLPSIAYTLPRRLEPYTSDYLFPFFSGLLAEGVVKEIQCRYLKLDENDEFGRLLATSLHFPTESALALELFRDGHYTAAYEARGFYSEPDFVELGALFGLPAEAVRARIARLAAAQEAVSVQVQRSLLSPEARTAYLAAYEERIKALLQR